MGMPPISTTPPTKMPAPAQVTVAGAAGGGPLPPAPDAGITAVLQQLTALVQQLQALIGQLGVSGGGMPADAFLGVVQQSPVQQSPLMPGLPVVHGGGPVVTSPVMTEVGPGASTPSGAAGAATASSLTPVATMPGFSLLRSTGYPSGIGHTQFQLYPGGQTDGQAGMILSSLNANPTYAGGTRVVSTPGALIVTSDADGRSFVGDLPSSGAVTLSNGTSVQWSVRLVKNSTVLEDSDLQLTITRPGGQASRFDGSAGTKDYGQFPLGAAEVDDLRNKLAAMSTRR